MVFTGAFVRSFSICTRRTYSGFFRKTACTQCRSLCVSSHFQSSNYIATVQCVAPKKPVSRSIGLITDKRHLCTATGTVQFNLSDIGEGIREVEIKEWFVKVGQRVAQFDSICEVQSDKAAVTITSRYDGIIKRLYYEAGDKAFVGKPLVDIELTHSTPDHSQSAPVEHLPSSAPSQQSQEQQPQKPQQHEQQQKSSEQEHSSSNVLATPAVRRLAKEKNVDLSLVKGTGREGRILKEDVIAAASGANVAPSTPQPVLHPAVPTKPVVEAPGDRVEPLRPIQKAMFRVMTASLAIPHFGYRDECDVSDLVAMRQKLASHAHNKSEKTRSKVTFMPFFIKAASLALRSYPILNAALDTSGSEPKLVYRSAHNFGVAMDTQDGLLVPVIRNVERLSVFEIAAELNRLQQAGLVGKLTPADLSGATFTLSNIGAIGGTYASPVLTPPQVCIGAIGKIQRVARVVSAASHASPNEKTETIKPVSIVCLSWSADHRVIDGASVARFSNAFKAYIEQPAFMMLDMK